MRTGYTDYGRAPGHGCAMTLARIHLVRGTLKIRTANSLHRRERDGTFACIRFAGLYFCWWPSREHPAI